MARLFAQSCPDIAAMDLFVVPALVQILESGHIAGEGAVRERENFYAEH